MLHLGLQIRAMAGLALICIALIGACSFDGGVQSAIFDAGVPYDARTDAATKVCDSNDENLALCLRFEISDDAIEVEDESQYTNHPIVTNAAFAQGYQGRGLVLDATFLSQIPESVSLDPLISLSIEMWLSPTGPIQSRQWLFDNENQWGMYLENGGVLGCDLGVGANLTSNPSVIVPGSWQHVACVYDGSTAKLYANAKELVSIDYTMDLRDQGTNGSCFGHDCPAGGSPYIGQMDTLRVWRIGLDRLTLCAGAGIEVADCPDSTVPLPD